MEQQTISIAKAGITTTLNSRCSVLAAANSVFGRWDDSKGDANIDFLPTILSRFDMIFIIKDEHDVAKDTVSLRGNQTNPLTLSLPPSPANGEACDAGAPECPPACDRGCCGGRAGPVNTQEVHHLLPEVS